MVERDILFEEVGKFVISKSRASVGMIQRVFKIGFNRAARILDQLTETGVIGEEDGIHPREIIMSSIEFEDLVKNMSASTELLTQKKNFADKYDDYSDNTTDNSNFSNDGESLKYLKNMIIHKCNENKQYEIIDYLISNNSPEKMRIIMFDSDVLTYNRYTNTAQLLIPIINDVTKLSAAINWIIGEKNDRVQKFIDNHVTNFREYNSNHNNYKKLPCLILIINELYVIHKISEIEETLTNLLLNGEKLGIYCILFTQFDSRNLSIGPMADLINTYNISQAKEIIGVKPKDNVLEINELAEIDKMDGIIFEKFCRNLLQMNGFTNIEFTPGSGDHGIDLLAEKDDITYAIQCKCYSSNIGNAAVQQAHTGKSIYHKDISVVMTNRYFTQQAIDEADSLGVKLWDRDRINYFMNQIN